VIIETQIVRLHESDCTEDVAHVLCDVLDEIAAERSDSDLARLSSVARERAQWWGEWDEIEDEDGWDDDLDDDEDDE
jgi:hypothetical protein